MNFSSRMSPRMVLLALVLPVVGCNGVVEMFLNQAASLGGPNVGGRGNVQVLFVNNTPYRAVFTIGSYDNMDQFTRPDFEQFGREDDENPLDGNSRTQLPFPFLCARVLAIGSAELFHFIEKNPGDDTPVDSAMVPGVEFWADEDGEWVIQGSAPPIEVRLGVDFACDSLLIFRCEFDDFGELPFRIDYEVIPVE